MAETYIKATRREGLGLFVRRRTPAGAGMTAAGAGMTAVVAVVGVGGAALAALAAQGVSARCLRRLLP